MPTTVSADPAGHLSREFRRAHGESLYAYLVNRRIERAMALLRRGDLDPAGNLLRIQELR